MDTRGLGFVNTPSAHYSWTGSGGYAVIPDAVTTITATLTSDGDLPLQLTKANVVANASGSSTPSAGTASVSATTCATSVPVGTTCTVTVNYKPTAIRCVGSPYGYAYTNIDLSLVTNTGQRTDFTEGFTVTGVKVCDD